MISYIFLKNRSHTIRANLDFAFDFYNSFNQRVSSLLDKWHEIDAYSNYFETSKKDGVKRTLHELYKLIDFVKSNLGKEVMQIRKYPKSSNDSIITKKIHNILDSKQFLLIYKRSNQLINLSFQQIKRLNV